MEGAEAQGGIAWSCGGLAGLGGVVVHRGGMFWHVHVHVETQKISRDKMLLCASKESKSKLCGCLKDLECFVAE